MLLLTEIGPGAAGATQALVEALPESALDEQLHEVFALAARLVRVLKVREKLW